jgi:hypothetical protein
VIIDAMILLMIGSLMIHLQTSPVVLMGDQGGQAGRDSGGDDWGENLGPDWHEAFLRVGGMKFGVS